VGVADNGVGVFRFHFCFGTAENIAITTTSWAFSFLKDLCVYYIQARTVCLPFAVFCVRTYGFVRPSLLLEISCSRACTTPPRSRLTNPRVDEGARVPGRLTVTPKYMLGVSLCGERGSTERVPVLHKMGATPLPRKGV